MPPPSKPGKGFWVRYLCEEMRAWMAKNEPDPEKAAAEVCPRVRAEYLAAYPGQEAEASRITNGE